MSRSPAEQRHWNNGYTAGYKAAHTVLQRELRAEYEARLAAHGQIRARLRAWGDRLIAKVVRIR